MTLGKTINGNLYYCCRNYQVNVHQWCKLHTIGTSTVLNHLPNPLPDIKDSGTILPKNQGRIPLTRTDPLRILRGMGCMFYNTVDRKTAFRQCYPKEIGVFRHVANV